MQVVPYLNFNGQCKEAFRFYEKCLGGRIERVMTHGETPTAGDVPPAWHKLIVNAQLVLGEFELMGMDAPPEQYSKPTGFHLSLMIKDQAESERIFNALAENGTIQMPYEKTFWAEKFGMVVDRFGIPWMVNCCG